MTFTRFAVIYAFQPTKVAALALFLDFSHFSQLKRDYGKRLFEKSSKLFF
jgi:hypothetical protein